jgi:disulfide oxidoreductase YuzD
LDVILVLDRNKLKTRYKLEPFNYNSIDADDFYKTKNKELEERVLNQKIYPVSNYLIDIIYKGSNPEIKEMLERYKP